MCVANSRPGLLFVRVVLLLPNKCIKNIKKKNEDAIFTYENKASDKNSRFSTENIEKVYFFVTIIKNDEFSNNGIIRKLPVIKTV